MATCSWSEFTAYEAYLRRFSDHAKAGSLSPFQRPLSLRRYQALARTRDVVDLEGLLLPPARPTPRVFLATALGWSESGAAYREDLHRVLQELGAEVLDPADWTDLREGPEHQLRTGRLDAAAIEAADRVLAVLDGADVDSRVAWALGYARALGKRLDAIKSDLGGSAAVAAGIVMSILDSGGRIVDSIQELPDLAWSSGEEGIACTS